MANLKIKGAPGNGTGACVLTVLAVLLSRFLVDNLWTPISDQMLTQPSLRRFIYFMVDTINISGLIKY
jgi:glucose-6-phosphate-specific signal transduction histidine kinase